VSPSWEASLAKMVSDELRSHNLFGVVKIDLCSQSWVISFACSDGRASSAAVGDAELRACSSLQSVASELAGLLARRLAPVGDPPDSGDPETPRPRLKSAAEVLHRGRYLRTGDATETHRVLSIKHNRMVLERLSDRGVIVMTLEDLAEKPHMVGIEVGP